MDKHLIPRAREGVLLTLIGKSWKTHPDILPNFQSLGHELDRFPWMSVPEIVLAHAPKNGQ